jgi:hypothetical protein
VRAASELAKRPKPEFSPAFMGRPRFWRFASQPVYGFVDAAHLARKGLRLGEPSHACYPA